MSLDLVLKELVSTVDAASGAILLEADGEAVQWYSRDSERLRLRAAYIAVVLKSYRASAVAAKLKRLNYLILAYDRASFIAQEIDDDCLLLLELQPGANVSEALFRIKPAIEKLRSEIGA